MKKETWAQGKFIDRDNHNEFELGSKPITEWHKHCTKANIYIANLVLYIGANKQYYYIEKTDLSRLEINN